MSRVAPLRQHADEQIIDRAAAFFARRGVAQTSVQAVADAVGVSNTGLLRHFPSKDALREAVLAHARDLGEQACDAVHDLPLGPARDRRAVEVLVDTALAGAAGRHTAGDRHERKALRDPDPLHDVWWHLALGGLLLGAGVAFSFASMANLIVAAVQQSEVGIATGINTVTRTVGGAFGSALSTAVLASTVGASGLPSDAGYTLAFGLAAAMALLAAGSALRVPRTSA